MRKLYEIDKDLEDLLEQAIDPETGEVVIDEEALADLQMEREKKIEGIALYVKDCRAEASMIKEEISNLKKRMDTLIRKADGAEGFIAKNLNGMKFSTPKVECSFRKSESVDVDEDFCRWAFEHGKYEVITHKESDEPNKAKIKQILKNGGWLEHCKLVEKMNISIK